MNGGRKWSQIGQTVILMIAVRKIALDIDFGNLNKKLLFGSDIIRHANAEATNRVKSVEEAVLA